MAENCSKCERRLEDDPGDHHLVSTDLVSRKPGSHIKIILLPNGEAPKWVRREWIGLVIPLHAKLKAPFTATKILSREQVEVTSDCYQVDSREALRLLAEKSPQAAEWWKENFSIDNNKALDFFQSECKIVP